MKEEPLKNRGCEISVELLSEHYAVRRISEGDIGKVYRLCAGNPLYYEYCPPFVTREAIREDLSVLPPGKEPEDKYYVGFYQGEALIAVMDLISGYPLASIAFIGFFMTESSVQSRGIGTAIIGDVCAYLSELGFGRVRLAWVKGNPQSEHFWLKNQFVPIKETVSSTGERVILAERWLD